jgi:Ni,Fe-hydrogenase maturation factor
VERDTQSVSLYQQGETMSTLFIGYGNPDRQDDGVAWHVLKGVADELGLETSQTWEDPLPSTTEVDFAFHLQLTPELAEDITAYDRVCFVDAHTGKIPENVQVGKLWMLRQSIKHLHSRITSPLRCFF